MDHDAAGKSTFPLPSASPPLPSPHPLHFHFPTEKFLFTSSLLLKPVASSASSQFGFLIRSDLTWLNYNNLIIIEGLRREALKAAFIICGVRAWVHVAFPNTCEQIGVNDFCYWLTTRISFAFFEFLSVFEFTRRLLNFYTFPHFTPFNSIWFGPLRRHDWIYLLNDWISVFEFSNL